MSETNKAKGRRSWNELHAENKALKERVGELESAAAAPSGAVDPGKHEALYQAVIDSVNTGRQLIGGCCSTKVGAKACRSENPCMAVALAIESLEDVLVQNGAFGEGGRTSLSYYRRQQAKAEQAPVPTGSKGQALEKAVAL